MTSPLLYYLNYISNIVELMSFYNRFDLYGYFDYFGQGRPVRAFSGRKIKFTQKIKLENWTFSGLYG